MKYNLALTLGAIACGASFVLAGCSDDTEPQKRDDTMSSNDSSGDFPGSDQIVGDNSDTQTSPSGEPAGNDTSSTDDSTSAPTAGDDTTANDTVMEMMMGGDVMAIGGGVPILPDPTGWVQADTNTVGIQGAWYSYNDCNDSPDDCTLNHEPPEGGFENVDGVMCTSGTTAEVTDEAEFSTKWGAGIALDLNALGGAAAGKSPWDATANGVKGFGFTVQFNTPGSVRVNLPTPATDVASHFVEVSEAGDREVLWGDVNQGSWIKPPDRVDFDPSSILSIQFQVPSKMMEAVPFDFCISNLTALQ